MHLFDLYVYAILIIAYENTDVNNMGKRTGRPPIHGEAKKSHTVRTTDAAWDGLKKMADKANLNLSEYLEFLGKTGRLP
ncbi:MAG: hypothetical protein F6K55_15700 [Moorea sp. SIO4A3]|nr:hypothetical protein [Moorena sp. SIO4A3]